MSKKTAFCDYSMRYRLLLSCVVATLVPLGILSAQQREEPRKHAPPKTGSAKVGAEPPKRIRNRIIADLSGFEIADPDQLKKFQYVDLAPMACRVFTDIPLAARRARLYGTNPVFRWRVMRSRPRGQTYTFILWTGDCSEVFRNEVRGSSFRYPLYAPPLELGKPYYWTLNADCESWWSGFLVISESERIEIVRRLVQVTGPNLYESSLARARIFTESRLWYDAIDTYSELIAN